jgi:3-oxoacyl-[acyl-carrier protein] reductase
METKNKVAVITGGGSGLGEAIARDLAQAGTKVVIGDVAETQIARVVEAIRKAGGEAAGVAANVTDEADMARLMDTAIDTFGSLNIVVANAGIIRDGLLINPDRESGKVDKVMSLEDFKAVIEVNLVGAFLTLREAARRMVDHGFPGVLIVTSSINKTGQAGQLNYSSTKAAVALWPKILTGEFHMRRIRNIRVASISPGYAATDILKNMNQKALDGILKDVHQQRLVEPAEIAAAVRFIIENDAVDGTDIEVTGGVCYAKSRAK